MGFTPDQIRSFSVAEFREALEGWLSMYNIGTEAPLERDGLYALMSKYPD